MASPMFGTILHKTLRTPVYVSLSVLPHLPSAVSVPSPTMLDVLYAQENVHELVNEIAQA